MAGDWIKMRGNLWDDPRIASLCDFTDAPEAMIIGGLYWLWSSADQHSENGVMPGLSLRAIDRKTGIKGFGDALVSIGWISDHIEGVRITRFEEHNGTSAKKRCATAKRVANHRYCVTEVTGDDESCNALSVTEVTGDDESCNALSVTQELHEEHNSVSVALVREREEKVNPVTSSLRSEVTPPLSAGKKITFKAWLALLKMKNEKPVSGYKPVFDYVAATGLPEDWVQIAWVQFSERYLDANNSRKRYVDWRQVFLNAIKGNWFRLWYFKDGVAYLSTVGQQADLETLEVA